MDANASEGEAGETSGATDQNIELQHRLKSIIGWDPSTRPLHEKAKAKIPLVPPVLREVESDKTCYDPQIVSIGPYHHGKAGLEEGEHLKTEVASYFIKKSGKSSDEIFNKVLEISEEARNFYVKFPDTVAFSDNEQFTRIMFLDGCFILQYMYSYRYKSAEIKRLHMMSSRSITLVAQDLLKVENQLPLIVINTLRVFGPGKSLPFSHVLRNCMWEMYGNQVDIFRCTPIDPVEREDHLLSIFRNMFLGRPKKDKTSFLLELFRRPAWLEARSFRSAKELQSVGVRFKVKSSAFPCFSSHLISAYLTLPKITIDTSTKAIFLNMLAYEMSKEGDPGDKRFTDFVCFMDWLIDHADDIKILRSSGVLNHSLGSDEQVADLFNHVSQNLIPSYEYWRVRRGIEKRYNSKISLWLGEMSHTYSLWLDEMWHSYFRSPWTLIALIVAVIYLGASLTQTYFTVFPRR